MLINTRVVVLALEGLALDKRQRQRVVIQNMRMQYVVAMDRVERRDRKLCRGGTMK